MLFGFSVGLNVSNFSNTWKCVLKAQATMFRAQILSSCKRLRLLDTVLLNLLSPGVMQRRWYVTADTSDQPRPMFRLAAGLRCYRRTTWSLLE